MYGCTNAAVGAGSALGDPLFASKSMMPTVAPTPATTNAMVEIVASDFADWRSSCLLAGHWLFGQSFFSDEVFDIDMNPVIAPATTAAPPTPNPMYASV